MTTCQQQRWHGATDASLHAKTYALFAALRGVDSRATTLSLYDHVNMPGGSLSRPPVWAEDEAARIAKLLRSRVRQHSSVRAVEKALGWAHGYLAGQLAGRVSLRLPVLLAVLQHLSISPSEFFMDLFPASPREVAGTFGSGSLYPSQPPRDPADLAPSLERQRRTDEALDYLFKELERVGVLDRRKVETAERILEGEEKGRGKP
jgi:hypothetical protein